jgi:ketosteroid isomerase-like protein
MSFHRTNNTHLKPNQYIMKYFIPFILFAVVCCQQTPASLTQSDKDAIQKNLNDFTQAVNKNTADLVNVYPEEIISLPPHEDEVVGKQKVIERHSGPGPKATSFTTTSQEIDGAGEMAFARGVWEFKGTLDDSIDIQDKGKYLVILKKQPDASWKMIREMWNSNLPIPGQ